MKVTTLVAEMQGIGEWSYLVAVALTMSGS